MPHTDGRAGEGTWPIIAKVHASTAMKWYASILQYSSTVVRSNSLLVIPAKNMKILHVRPPRIRMFVPYIRRIYIYVCILYGVYVYIRTRGVSITCLTFVEKGSVPLTLQVNADF